MLSGKIGDISNIRPLSNTDQQILLEIVKCHREIVKYLENRNRPVITPEAIEKNMMEDK